MVNPPAGLVSPFFNPPPGDPSLGPRRPDRYDSPVVAPAPIQRNAAEARQYKIAWRILLILSLVFTAVKIDLNIQRPRELLNHQLTEAAKHRAAATMPFLIPDLFSQAHDSPAGFFTKGDLERRINNGQPFRTHPLNAHDETADWVNPASQMKWQLLFRDGRWISDSGVDYVGWKPLPAPSALYQITEQLRRTWLAVGFWLWCVLLVLLYFVWSQRAGARLIVHLMVAAALLNTLAKLLEPYNFLRLALPHYGFLYLGGLMLLLSWLIRGDFKIDPVPEGFCRACGYNLTGNQSGICPECGSPAPAAASSPST